MPGCWGDLGLISGKVPGRRCMRKGCFLSASQHVFPDFPHVPAEGVLRLWRRRLDIPFLHFSSHLEKEFLLVGSVFFADGGESQLRPREAAFEKERQIVLPGAPEVFRASFCSDGGEQFPDLAFPDARSIHADGGFHVGQREFQHDSFNGLSGLGQLGRGEAHDLGAQGGQGFQDSFGVSACARPGHGPHPGPAVPSQTVH